MSWLLDTSVLIGVISAGSTRHLAAKDAVIELLVQNETIVVFPQNLVEFWAVATRPIDANGLGMTIDDTRKEIDKIKFQFALLPENETIFDNWELLVNRFNVSGKTTHDARLVAAMRSHNIKNILTFNVNDFRRYAEIINAVSPNDMA